MFKRKEKAFTLIELIATLVIMAIIALIVTPLVMNIIRKARIFSDRRSVDAYGRSIELAIAGYLLDTGKFPTSVEQLTIEYSGNEVVCETTQINTDSSVYLEGCTVAGRNVGGYTYGSDKSPTYTAYTVGNLVTYNNIDYYVIKDSGAKESSVTLVKAEPLTVDEVNTYGTGHVNRYTSSSVGTAYNQNGYGAMAYYTSETCGYVNNNLVEVGCTPDYAQSEIKYVVDAWKTAKAPVAIEARLISLDDLKKYLGYVLDTDATSENYKPSFTTPNWIYGNYRYCTNTTWDDSMIGLWYIRGEDGIMNTLLYVFDFAVVRPVIVLPKSALSS